jgi:hypothetical protein
MASAHFHPQLSDQQNERQHQILSKKKPFPVHPYHEYQPAEEEKLIVLNLMYLKDFQKFSVGSRLCSGLNT